MKFSAILIALSCIPLTLNAFNVTDEQISKLESECASLISHHQLSKSKKEEFVFNCVVDLIDMQVQSVIPTEQPGNPAPGTMIATVEVEEDPCSS